MRWQARKRLKSRSKHPSIFPRSRLAPLVYLILHMLRRRYIIDGMLYIIYVYVIWLGVCEGPNKNKQLSFDK